MNLTQDIKPFCPVSDWISRNPQTLPQQYQTVFLNLFNQSIAVESNDVNLIAAVSKRLNAYLCDEKYLDKHQLLTISISEVETALRIDVPPDWKKKPSKKLASVFLSPHHHEHTKLTHLKWGSCECYHRSSDFLASICPDSKAPIRILLARGGCSHSDDSIIPINNDILLDFLQGLYANINDFHTLHAAFLCIGGKGVVIGGHSGCGKTTTAMALLRSGFSLFSDELTLIRRGKGNTLEAAGWFMPPRFVSRAPTDIEHLEETLPSADERSKQVYRKIASLPKGKDIRPEEFELKKTMVLPESIISKTLGQWMAPTAIVLLQKSSFEQSEHVLRPMDQQMAFTALMGQTLDPTKSSRIEEQIDIILDLVKSCSVYELTLGNDISSLPELFRHLLR
jgi:hypothetical protein